MRLHKTLDLKPGGGVQIRNRVVFDLRSAMDSSVVLGIRFAVGIEFELDVGDGV